MRLDRQTDERLLQPRTSGHAGATFGEFYRRHELLVLAFTARRTRNAADAADLTAEIFEAALRSRYRFRSQGPGSATAWLLGIAQNVLRQHARKHAKEATIRHPSDSPFVDPADTAAIRALEQLEEEDQVMRILESLPDRQREAVREFVVNDSPYGDIAVSLACTNAAARQLVSRGLRTLRANLNSLDY